MFRDVFVARKAKIECVISATRDIQDSILFRCGTIGIAVRNVDPIKMMEEGRCMYACRSVTCDSKTST